MAAARLGAEAAHSTSASRTSKAVVAAACPVCKAVAPAPAVLRADSAETRVSGRKVGNLKFRRGTYGVRALKGRRGGGGCEREGQEAPGRHYPQRLWWDGGEGPGAGRGGKGRAAPALPPRPPLQPRGPAISWQAEHRARGSR